MSLAAAIAINTNAINCLQSGRVNEALALWETAYNVVQESNAQEAQTALLAQLSVHADALELPRGLNDNTIQPLPMVVSSCGNDSLDMEENEGEEMTQLDLPEQDTSASETPNEPTLAVFSNGLPPVAFFIWSVPMDSTATADMTSAATTPTRSIFALYTRPFEFRMSESASSEPSRYLRCATALPIILGYNMGLAHHTKATQATADVDATALYNQAIVCYVSAYHCIQDQVVLLGGYYDMELDILVLALLNNMGHCWSTLDQDEFAANCWNRMRICWTTTLFKYRLCHDESIFFGDRMTLGRRSMRGYPSSTVTTFLGPLMTL